MPKKGQKKPRSALAQDQPDSAERKVERIITPGTAVMLRELITASAVRTRLKWFARVAITSTAGAVTPYVIRHNGLFDPDSSGGATQPEGFDEWMSMYDRFRVVSSKIKVRFASTGTTNLNGSCVLVITPSGSGTSFATVADAESAPFAVAKIYVFGGPPVTVSKLLSTATLEGVAPTAILAEQSYSGTAAADPADPTYWHLTYQALDAATTVSSHLLIEVEYVVDFFDRNNFAISVDSEGNPVRTRKFNLKRDNVKPSLPPGSRVASAALPSVRKLTC